MSKVSCQKSQKCLLTSERVEKKVFLNNNFAETFLSTRTKQFWWPLFFFCHKPDIQQLKVKTEGLFFSFEFLFFSFKFPLDYLKAVLAKPAKKLRQTTKKFSMRVQKNMVYNSKNIVLQKQKDLVDTRVLILTTLPKGFHNRLELFLHEIREIKAQFSKKFTFKTSFPAR